MDTETALAGLRREFKTDTEYAPPSKKQLGMLAGLMGKVFDCRDDRIEALRFITGLSMIRSSSHLTREVVAIMIDFLHDEILGGLSPEGEELLIYVRDRIEF